MEITNKVHREIIKSIEYIGKKAFHLYKFLFAKFLFYQKNWCLLQLLLVKVQQSSGWFIGPDTISYICVTTKYYKKNDSQTYSDLKFVAITSL